MEAFAIIGCLLSLGRLVARALQMMSGGHLGVTMRLGFSAVMTELTAWTLIVHEYHKHNCAGDRVYAVGINRLDAGFALACISFTLMLLAVIPLAPWLNKRLSLSEFHGTMCHISSLMSSFNGCVLTIATVGAAQHT